MSNVRTNLYRRRAVYPLLLLTLLLFGIIALTTPAQKWAVSAAPIATPAAAAPVTTSPPVPNPVPFSFVPGTVVSSSQVNSNFYVNAYNLNATIAQLNACTWIPGAAIGTIVATAPLVVNVGACTAGTGVGATANFSLSAVPSTLLPATVAYTNAGNSFSSSQTFNGGALFNSGTFAFLGPHQGSDAISGTQAYIPPQYTNTGVADAFSSSHIVHGVSSTGSLTCSALTLCTTLTVNFAGQAAWQSLAAYDCVTSANLPGYVTDDNRQSTAAMYIDVFTLVGRSAAPAVFVSYVCSGY